MAKLAKEGPPTLKEIKRVFYLFMESQLGPGAKECWCSARTPDMMMDPPPCEACEARELLARLTDEALERDEKRVALDSRRRAAYENLFKAVRYMRAMKTRTAQDVVYNEMVLPAWEACRNALAPTEGAKE